MECWSTLRSWIVSEKKELEFIAVLDELRSSYLLIFDHELVLTYINNCYAEHIGTIFTSKLKVDYKDRYHLSELLATFSGRDDLIETIHSLVASKQNCFSLEHPGMRLKFSYNKKDGLESVLVYIKIEDKHIIDPDWSVNFVLQPINTSDADMADQRVIIGSPKTDDLISHYLKTKASNINKNEVVEDRKDSLSSSMINLNSVEIQTRTASPVSQPKLKRSHFTKANNRIIKPILMSSRTINFEGSILLKQKATASIYWVDPR